MIVYLYQTAQRQIFIVIAVTAQNLTNANWFKSRKRGHLFGTRIAHSVRRIVTGWKPCGPLSLVTEMSAKGCLLGGRLSRNSGSLNLLQP